VKLIKGLTFIRDLHFLLDIIRLGYSLRGRRGLSVRVGNDNNKEAYIGRESSLDKAGALCNQKFTQELIFLALSSVICINKHVLNFTNVALLCVAKSLGGVGN
jgi:hypothetical protein